VGFVVNNRLEASTRGTDLTPGLQAQVHDALWLLARQRQLGEFEGSDAGSPVAAAYVVSHAPLASWHAAGGATRAYGGTVPLEALVEADGTPVSWPERVAAGLRLARALRRVGLDPAALTAAHPLTAPDPATAPSGDPASHATSTVTPDEVAAFGAVYAARVADPVAVTAAFATDLDALVTVAGGPPARPILTAWRAWWATRQPAPAGAWQHEQLSYALAVATADTTLPTYTTDRFGGGTLDWYVFDAAAPPPPPPPPPPSVPPPSPAPVTSTPAPPASSTPATATAPTGPTAPPSSVPASSSLIRALPVPVAFHGAPVDRYWQLEDASTDLGAVETYPTELGKLLLAEFTACFAGDWFRLPVRIPYGGAVHVDALVSTDTFGVQTLIPEAAAQPGSRPWRLFEHTAADGTSVAGTWLLVPPPLTPTMEAEALEEVALVRDPAADLAWGIEKLVTNAVGRPVRRADDLAAQGRGTAADPRDGLADAWVWRLMTTVPDNWIPLLPTRGRAATDDYLLVQASMLHYDRSATGAVTAVRVLPAGVALRAGGSLPEREIPREGVTLTRTRRLARWVDGSRVHWTSRARSIGHGEATSGLGYDGIHATSSDPTALAD
jgi:hypothetical protein